MPRKAPCRFWSDAAPAGVVPTATGAGCRVRSLAAAGTSVRRPPGQSSWTGRVRRSRCGPQDRRPRTGVAALVPLAHVNGAHVLTRAAVEMQPADGVLIGGVLPRLFDLAAEVVLADADAQVGVRLLPDLR